MFDELKEGMYLLVEDKECVVIHVGKSLYSLINIETWNRVTAPLELEDLRAYLYKLEIAKRASIISKNFDVSSTNIVNNFRCGWINKLKCGSKFKIDGDNYMIVSTGIDEYIVISTDDGMAFGLRPKSLSGLIFEIKIDSKEYKMELIEL